MNLNRRITMRAVNSGGRRKVPAKRPRRARGQEKGSNTALPSRGPEDIDYLLDEALQATFPASDPVAIGSARVQGRR
jgi:hypothetical protein